MIESNSDILGGTPCIAGTRIPVTAIQAFNDAGYNMTEIMKEYPTLTAEQINDAIKAYSTPTAAQIEDAIKAYCDRPGSQDN